MKRTKANILLAACLVLFLSAFCYAETENWYVDPDAGGAGNGLDWTNAYTSLNAFEAAEANDLDTANDIYIVHCRASSSSDDTTQCVILGWTTSATDYLEIRGNDFPTDGVWDDTKYLIHLTDNSTGSIYIREDHVRITNLQIKTTVTANNTGAGLYVRGGLAAGTVGIFIDSCIIRGDCAGTGAGYGINEFDGDVKVYNTVIYDFVSGADTSFYGIYNNNADHTTTAYNCTVYNCYTGIRENNGTLNAYNCAVGSCTDDISITNGTTDYCCSDDNDGTNSQTPSGGNWDNEFITPGTDFDLESGGNCVGNGTDNPGAGLYSDDIIGTARSSTWDIGAFELAAAVAAGQVIIIKMN